MSFLSSKKTHCNKRRLKKTDFFSGRLAGMAAARASAASGRFNRRLFGCFGDRLALVIGLIETGPFEDHAGTGTDQALKFGFAAFWAFIKFGFGHGLKSFKPMPAGRAFIFVSRHVGVLSIREAPRDPALRHP